MHPNLSRARLRWLAAALLATTLTACGGSGGGAEPEPALPTQPGGPTTPEPSNPDPTPTTPTTPDPSSPNPTPTTPTVPDPSTPGTPTPTVPTTPTPTIPTPPDPPPAPPIPPMTVRVMPESGSLALPANTTVSAVFSSALNTATLNTASFSVLEDASGQRHPMALSRTGPSEATLTPLSRYRYNTRYRVQLASSITGAAGNAFAGTTTFFTTAEGLWGTPTSAIGSVVNSEAPSLAVAPNGNAVVAFQANAGTGIKDVRAVSYNAATGVWDGSSEFLSNRMHDVAGPVKVVMDNQGSAIAVWSQLNGTASNGTGTRTDVFSSRKRFDGVWTTANLLEADDRGNTSVPDVAADAAGNAIAVWQQFDSMTPVTGTVYFSRYDVATGVWSLAAPLETATHPAVAPKIAMNAAGNALVVYRNDGNLIGRRYSVNSGAWEARQFVHRTFSASVTRPQIRMNAEGNAVAVYEIASLPGARTDIYASYFDASTNSWPGSSTVESVDTGPATIPQVSIDPAGNITAVWRQSIGGGNEDIYANYMPWSTKVWGTASSVTPGFGGEDNPQIADDAGGPVLVFEFLNGVKRLNSTRLRQGLAPFTNEPVEQDPGAASQPQIAIDPQGRAILAYRYLLNGNQRTRAAHMR